MIRETRACASRDITQAVGPQAMRAAHRCQATDSLLHEYAGRTAENADEATYLSGAPPRRFLQTPRRQIAAGIARMSRRCAAASGRRDVMRFKVRSIGVLLVLASCFPAFRATVRGSGDNHVEFDLTDEPGAWYRSTAGPIAGSNSLAVAAPGVEVKFSGRSHTVHTMTSLIFPSNALGMLFGTGAQKGSASVVLKTPGLYVFVCQIHP